MNKFAVGTELTGHDIKLLRKRLGLTQMDFSQLVNVSVKTIERWETSNKPITGPIVTLAGIFRNMPQLSEELQIPAKEYPIRLWYMYKDEICTLIDVDEHKRKIRIKNYVPDNMFRAFGRKEHPTFEDYEEFLKSRCFPETRDKMKLMLRGLDLPFYDTFLIIEKTQGRMAEDDFWIRIEH